MEEQIIYEQPLNEIVRVFLRLEFLFRQADYFVNSNNALEVRVALNSIIDILNIIDRPDLKGKLVNVLQLQYATLLQFEQKTNMDIDRKKLHEILQQLDDAQTKLHTTHGKLGQSLRENEFISAIRQKLNIPAGTCEFAMPSYYLWLHRPIEELRVKLHHWLDEFGQLRAIVNLLLQLTRNSVPSRSKSALDGFYQEALSPNIPYQLIRVGIAEKNIYPEISVGRHRLSIYFLAFQGTRKHSVQVKGNVSFTLTCCKLLNFAES